MPASSRSMAPKESVEHVLCRVRASRNGACNERPLVLRCLHDDLGHSRTCNVPERRCLETALSMTQNLCLQMWSRLSSCRCFDARVICLWQCCADIRVRVGVLYPCHKLYLKCQLVTRMEPNCSIEDVLVFLAHSSFKAWFGASLWRSWALMAVFTMLQSSMSDWPKVRRFVLTDCLVRQHQRPTRVFTARGLTVRTLLQ